MRESQIEKKRKSKMKLKDQLFIQLLPEYIRLGNELPEHLRDTVTVEKLTVKCLQNIEKILKAKEDFESQSSQVVQSDWLEESRISFSTKHLGGEGRKAENVLRINTETHQLHAISVFNKDSNLIFSTDGDNEFTVEFWTEGSLEHEQFIDHFKSFDKKLNRSTPTIPQRNTWLIGPNERVLCPQQNKDLTEYLDKAKKPGQ